MTFLLNCFVCIENCDKRHYPCLEILHKTQKLFNISNLLIVGAVK